MHGRRIAPALGAAALAFAVLLALGWPAPAYAVAIAAMTFVAVATPVSANVQIAAASAAAVVLGVLPDSGIEQVQIVGRLFISLLKMLIAPMILLSIVHGIAGMSRARDFGRMGTRTVVLYVATMALAVLTGLVFVNLFQPGAGSELRHSEFFAKALAEAGDRRPPPTSPSATPSPAS